MNAFGSIGSYSLAASPLLPWWVIIAFAVLAALILAFGAFRRARGTLWRLAAAAMLVLILLDPSLVQEQRQPQKDVAVVVVDDSPSMRIGQRRQYADAALQSVTQKLAAFKDLDVRVVHAGAPDPDAPLHVLLTGQPGEADRRLVIKDAPSFGIVGKDVQLNVRVEDLPDGGSG